MGFRMPLRTPSGAPAPRPALDARRYRVALERIDDLCGRLEVGGANAHRIVHKISREVDLALRGER